jgi:hypothetical protein
LLKSLSLKSSRLFTSVDTTARVLGKLLKNNDR